MTEDTGVRDVIGQCLAWGCTKVDLTDSSCAAFTDPRGPWTRGRCPALTTDPDWEDKHAKTVRAYSDRLHHRKSKVWPCRL